MAFKPTSTIAKKQNTVSRDGEDVDLVARGRHDPCVVPRAVPMVEAMVALVLADQLLQVRPLNRKCSFFIGVFMQLYRDAYVLSTSVGRWVVSCLLTSCAGGWMLALCLPVLRYVLDLILALLDQLQLLPLSACCGPLYCLTA